MLRYEGIKFVLISPEELKVPEYVIENMQKAGAEFYETESLEDAMPELDILYMTRIQKERFFNEEDYVRLKDSYILNLEKLDNAKEDLLLLPSTLRKAHQNGAHTFPVGNRKIV